MEPGRSGDANAGRSSWGHGPESQAVNGLLNWHRQVFGSFCRPRAPGAVELFVHDSVYGRLPPMRGCSAVCGLDQIPLPSQSTTNSGDRW